MKDYKSLSSTTQERIRDLLRPVLGEVDDPKAAQMSQAELSRMLGINSATLSRFMSGKTVTITKKISGGLNASEKIPSLRLHFPGVYAIFQRIIIQERQKP